MTDVAQFKIDVALPEVVLDVLARACGFRLFYDRATDPPVYTLSARRDAGVVRYVVEHAGTRESVCAFLAGYAAAQQVTSQILNEVEHANRKLVDDMRRRVLGRKEGTND